MDGLSKDSWSFWREYHAYQDPGATDGVDFILLSPNHDIYMGSHSRPRSGSHPAPHFTDGETDLVLGYQLSRDRGTAGSQTKTCVRSETMLNPPLL